MRLQDFFSSGAITQLGIYLAQYMPQKLGYGLAQIAAAVIVRRKPQIYWTVRANLRQVVGPGADQTALHNMARRLFAHAGQTYYDFFHVLGRPPEVHAKMIRIPESLVDHIRSEMSKGNGMLLLGMHMSNFDLALLAFGAYGFSVQVLTVSDPVPGFHVLNRLRARAGFEVTPITRESLRTAVRRLKGGGLVVTAGDRPIPEDRALISFFGRPAYLPLGPARLAMMSEAKILMCGCHYDSQQGYVLEVTGPIELVRTGNWRKDMLDSTGRLAAILEGYVRAHPEQWMMFYPLWPEL
jgi:lauroyl/myristoyl acyltransferase